MGKSSIYFFAYTYIGELVVLSHAEIEGNDEFEQALSQAEINANAYGVKEASLLSLNEEDIGCEYAVAVIKYLLGIMYDAAVNVEPVPRYKDVKRSISISQLVANMTILLKFFEAASRIQCNHDRDAFSCLHCISRMILAFSKREK